MNLKSALSRYSVVNQRDYQKECIKDIVEALNKSSDFLIDLPTGGWKNSCLQSNSSRSLSK